MNLGETLFAPGLVMTLENGEVNSFVIRDATDDVKRISNVIRGARLLFNKYENVPLAAATERWGSKSITRLTKTSDAYYSDMVTLSVNEGSSKVLHGSLRGKVDKNRIMVHIEGKHIRMESDLVIMDIVYIKDADDALRDPLFTTAEQEKQRVRDENLHRAETEAWALERTKIIKGFRTRWTENEVSEILKNNKLPNYKATYRWSPERYPELAASGRNIVFIHR